MDSGPHVPRSIEVRLENVPVCTVKLVARAPAFQQARERVHLRRVGGVDDDMRRSTLRAYLFERLRNALEITSRYAAFLERML